MNVGLLPVIGIALPFVSAGGSHLMVDFIMLGMILNINNR
jgi:rod shape determining protein RodA